MRAFHKSWQSDRPLKPDSRRVKWYQGSPGESIKLQFEDRDRCVFEYYNDPADAKADFEAFAAGTLTTADISRRQQPS